MLSIATSLGRSGFQDWIIQRVSAVILAAYTVFLLVFCFLQPELNTGVWQKLFTSSLMKYASFVVLLAIIMHAWIGLWTVTTDYLKTSWFRLVVQILIYVTLLFYLIWGIQILWGC